MFLLERVLTRLHIHIYNQSKKREIKFEVNNLPIDVLREIFGHLQSNALAACCLVNRKWRQLASDPTLWEKVIKHENDVFDKKKWEIYFKVDIGKEPPLPRLKKALNPRWLVLIPKTINGEPLTLKSLGGLIKQYFPENKHGYYSYIFKSENMTTKFLEEQGDTPNDKSRWVAMARKIDPKSLRKSYAQQKKLFDSKIPKGIEALVCMIAEYATTGNRLYSDNDRFIRCQEKDNVRSNVSFTPKGPIISQNYSDEGYSFMGIAPLQRF